MNSTSEEWTFADPETINIMKKLFSAIQKNHKMGKALPNIFAVMVMASCISGYFFAFEWFNNSWLKLILASIGIGGASIALSFIIFKFFFSEEIGDKEKVYQKVLKNTSNKKLLAKFLKSNIGIDEEPSEFLQFKLKELIDEFCSNILGNDWEVILKEAGFRESDNMYKGPNFHRVMSDCAGNTEHVEKYRNMMFEKPGPGGFNPFYRYKFCGGHFTELDNGSPEIAKMEKELQKLRRLEHWNNPYGGYTDSYIGIESHQVYASRLCFAGVSDSNESISKWFILHQTFDNNGLKSTIVENI